MALRGVPSNLCIILNKTQLAENTGMAIRAMVNTGVKNLRLVSPQHGWPNETADLASAEKSALLNLEIFDNLKDAIFDLQLVLATSARHRNMIKEIYSPETASIEILKSDASGIVFGSEQSGLTNEEISLCNGVIEIPSADFSSYNLAQAVLLTCYQFVRRSNIAKLEIGKTAIAKQKDVDCLLNILETELKNRNHFPSARKQTLMMQTIRNFFKRARPTVQEIQSLRGVVSTLTDVGRKRL